MTKQERLKEMKSRLKHYNNELGIYRAINYDMLTNIQVKEEFINETKECKEKLEQRIKELENDEN